MVEDGESHAEREARRSGFRKLLEDWAGKFAREGPGCLSGACVERCQDMVVVCVQSGTVHAPNPKFQDISKEEPIVPMEKKGGRERRAGGGRRSGMNRGRRFLGGSEEGGEAGREEEELS
eukprot:1211912-Rhodomonas_salina.1